jgi:hypothetical protein
MIDISNKNQEGYYDDTTEDNTDYYYNSTSTNNKQDPGATRLKNKKVKDLTLEDAKTVPEMPKVMLKEPSEKEYNKRRGDLEKKIKVNKDEIVNIFSNLIGKTKRKDEIREIRKQSKNNRTQN